METVTIRQELNFKVSSEEFYKTFLDEKKHAAFTQSEVHISDKEGDDFTAYDGYIEGKNFELMPNKRIVQIWKAQEAEWPDEHWSVIEINLKDNGEGCHVEFVHKDLPKNVADSIDNGWHEYYWEPLKDYFD